MVVFSTGVFQQRTADVFWQQPPNQRRDKARPYPLHPIKSTTLAKAERNQIAEMDYFPSSTLGKENSCGFGLNRRRRHSNSETSARHSCHTTIGEQEPVDVVPLRETT
jgi:hypothetical protein